MEHYLSLIRMEQHNIKELVQALRKAGFGVDVNKVAKRVYIWKHEVSKSMGGIQSG